MSIDQLRRVAAEQIRANHRRATDGAAPLHVTIFESSPFFDRVRVEYADGDVREFMRARPIDTDIV